MTKSTVVLSLFLVALLFVGTTATSTCVNRQPIGKVKHLKAWAKSTSVKVGDARARS